MAFLQWRKFNFFDKETLKDTTALSKLQDVTCYGCGRSQLLLGDSQGWLHTISRQMEVSSVRMYAIRITHMYQLRQHGILVTVGDDDEGVNPLLKVWNLDKVDREGGPLCCRIVRAIPGTSPTTVTCVTVHENLNLMAVGFHNGSIVLFRGDVTRDRHSKQRLLYEGSDPITGLAFKNQNAKLSLLYACTEHHVIALSISHKDKECPLSILDQHGCSIGCWTMSDPTRESQFIVARPEALYLYQDLERGPCLAFEGHKLLIYWARGYLLVVSREQNVPSSGMQIVTIYDVDNKLIAYAGPVPAVKAVMYEWGAFYLLSQDNKLLILQEKDTSAKLELLFKKNLYHLAIDLAQSHQYEQAAISDIFRQYGDHLYSKGDYDGAVQQYIKTVGHLEPSYVIGKFLDAQRIHNLEAYLQALHAARLATEDHTTLLLNCYTKLRDTDKLEHFIKSDEGEVTFDVETAIRVCRAAGYYKQALYLAQNHSQDDWQLRIHLEDLVDVQAALAFLNTLSTEQAIKYVKKYGKVLLQEAPEDTTRLLKKLCTREAGASADEFIHIFVNRAQQLQEFLEHQVIQGECTAGVYNTLIELQLQQLASTKGDAARRTSVERQLMNILSQHHEHYHLDQVLVLCKMHNFKAGILFLYEKAQLYQQILIYHMENGEHSHILETCKKFGENDPGLWIQALSYFGKQEDCRKELGQVLNHIDKYNLLSPTQVLRTLAQTHLTTLAMVKNYILEHLRKEQEEIAEDQRLMQSLQQQTDAIRQQCAQLATAATIFNNTKCQICGHALDMPSVHFLCQHSFHQHCFESYTDDECPVCLPENQKIIELVEAQEASRLVHEQFHEQLARSEDPFTTVAEYFGKGLFNKVTLVTPPTDTERSQDESLSHPTNQPSKPLAKSSLAPAVNTVRASTPPTVTVIKEKIVQNEPTELNRASNTTPMSVEPVRPTYTLKSAAPEVKPTHPNRNVMVAPRPTHLPANTLMAPGVVRPARPLTSSLAVRLPHQPIYVSAGVETSTPGNSRISSSVPSSVTRPNVAQTADYPIHRNPFEDERGKNPFEDETTEGKNPFGEF